MMDFFFFRFDFINCFLIFVKIFVLDFVQIDLLLFNFLAMRAPWFFGLETGISMLTVFARPINKQLSANVLSIDKIPRIICFLSCEIVI